MKVVSKMSDKIIFSLAVLANFIMLAFALYLMVFAYGNESRLALLLAAPPVLSLIALFNTGGIEERRMKTQLRKAQLRKQLKELEEFTK